MKKHTYRIITSNAKGPYGNKIIKPEDYASLATVDIIKAIKLMNETDINSCSMGENCIVTIIKQ